MRFLVPEALKIARWTWAANAPQGRLRCPRGTRVQSVLFPKSGFPSPWSAALWLRKYRLRDPGPRGWDETRNYWRARQADPAGFTSFATISVGRHGVKLVIGCPRGATRRERIAANAGAQGRFVTPEEVQAALEIEGIPPKEWPTYFAEVAWYLGTPASGEGIVSEKSQLWSILRHGEGQGGFKVFNRGPREIALRLARRRNPLTADEAEIALQVAQRLLAQAPLTPDARFALGKAGGLAEAVLNLGPVALRGRAREIARAVSQGSQVIEDMLGLAQLQNPVIRVPLGPRIRPAKVVLKRFRKQEPREGDGVIVSSRFYLPAKGPQVLLDPRLRFGSRAGGFDTYLESTWGHTAGKSWRSEPRTLETIGSTWKEAFDTAETAARRRIAVLSRLVERRAEAHARHGEGLPPVQRRPRKSRPVSVSVPEAETSGLAERFRGLDLLPEGEARLFDLRRRAQRGERLTEAEWAEIREAQAREAAAARAGEVVARRLELENPSRRRSRPRRRLNTSFSDRLGYRLHELTLEGRHDEETGDVSEVGLWAALLTRTGLRGAPHAIVFEDDQGFGSYQVYRTEKEARRAFRALERELYPPPPRVIPRWARPPRRPSGRRPRGLPRRQRPVFGGWA